MPPLWSESCAGILALAEPNATASLLIALGALVAISVLFSRTADRLGVPVVLLFLVLGMLGGSEGIGGIEFEDYSFAMRIGTIALVLILFDGGLSTSAAAVRQVLLPASVLATVGVAMTAGLVALMAHLLGMSWQAAMLLGAVVSSTDAAAVFALLRGGKIQLQPRLARTLELESCANDPMAVILTTAVIQVVQSGRVPVAELLLSVPIQLAIGSVVGLGIGFLARATLRRVPLTTVGLYPALTLSVALLSFGAATVLGGSGFLAVFLTACVLGNGSLPYRSGLMRIHNALAWLAQITMFLMLGLLIFPSRLPSVAGAGLALGLGLAIIARPVAVALCLAPFRYPMSQIIYLSWTGLRGAVPIILATFPVLARVPHAERLFDLVFFIVVVNALVPGATIRWLTKRLKLDMPEQPAPAAVLEINAPIPLDGEIVSFRIVPELVVSGARLSDIEFPERASVVLVVRGQELIAAKGDTTLMPDDHAYIFFRQAERPFIELLFGAAEQ